MEMPVPILSGTSLKLAPGVTATMIRDGVASR
jgi:hypothetical protein